MQLKHQNIIYLQFSLKDILYFSNIYWMNRDKSPDTRLKVKLGELFWTISGLGSGWGVLDESLGEAHGVDGLDPHHGTGNLDNYILLETSWKKKM